MKTRTFKKETVSHKQNLYEASQLKNLCTFNESRKQFKTIKNKIEAFDEIFFELKIFFI